MDELINVKAFVATLVDVTGLIIYFSTARLFLAGQLLYLNPLSAPVWAGNRGRRPLGAGGWVSLGSLVGFVTLFGITLLMNILSGIVLRRFREVYE